MAMSKKDGGKAATGKTKAAARPATVQAKKKPAKKG
jgi:hypothetical protein